MPTNEELQSCINSLTQERQQLADKIIYLESKLQSMYNQNNYQSSAIMHLIRALNDIDRSTTVG